MIYIFIHNFIHNRDYDVVTVKEYESIEEAEDCCANIIRNKQYHNADIEILKIVEGEELKIKTIKTVSTKIKLEEK